MTNIVGEIGVLVRPVTSGFRADASRQMQTAGADAGRQFGRGFARSLTAGLGAAAIGVTIARSLRSTVTAAAEQESATLLLARAIKNARAETTLYGKSIGELLKEEQLLTGFTDESLASAFGRLVQVTRNSERAFTDLQLAEDVSRQRKLSVEAAALALAKAEGGNVTALQRLGIVIPKHITQLKGAERGTAALALVQQRFGGSAEAFARGTEGSFQRAAQGVDELKETIGEALTPVLGDAADELRVFVSDEDNLRRVQEATTDAVKVGTQVLRGAISAFRTMRTILTPLVDLLGGVEHATELAFGLILVRRLRAATVAMRAFGLASVTTGRQVQAAQARVAAGSLAQGFPAFSLFRGGRAARVGGAAIAGTVAGTAFGGPGGPSITTGALAGGLVGGVPGAAVGAGSVALSRAIREIPGVERESKRLGAAVHDLASVFGLATKSVTVNQQEIARETAVLVARQRALRAAEAIPQTGSEGGLAASIAASRGAAGAPTAGRTFRGATTSFTLRRLRAERTQTTADDLALFREREAFLQRQIDNIERAGVRGRNDRQRLEGLYGQLIEIDSAISSIEQATRDQQAAAAEERRRRAEEEKARREEERQRAIEERRAAAEEARAARQRRIDLREARLQNRVARAELTESENDDRGALRALARFYRIQRNNLRRRGALIQAEQAEANRLSTVARIRGLGETAPGDKAQRFNFFQEAADQFRNLGSNIAGRGGVLSGGDARALFAFNALTRREAVEQTAQTTRQAQLTEAQKQTLILETIRAALHGRRVVTNPPAADDAPAVVREQAIRAARLAAQVISF